MKSIRIGTRRHGREDGFTLVELVAVITVLGVLGAAALPRMTALAGDARHASLNGARGALSAVATLAHARFLIDSRTTQTFEDSTVALAYGYPAATPATVDAAGLTADYVIDTHTAGAMTLVPKDIAGTAKAADCFLVYEQASAAHPVPSIRLGGNATARTCGWQAGHITAQPSTRPHTVR
jgi:MSHA pilin protein MshA